MKIWIFNNYNMLPEHGHLNRAWYFGKELKKMGHEPTVFVGSHPHSSDLQLITDRRKYEIYQEKPFPWVLIKTCKYRNDKIKRVWSMFQYYFNSLHAAKNFGKPDAIIGSSAHPLAAVLAIKLGKRFNCKKIVEVRDLWPESIVAYGIAGPKNPAVLLLRRLEKWIYKNADRVVFTMEGAYDYIREQGWEKDVPISKVRFINNGVDLEEFNANKKQFITKDEDLDNLETFKVLYAGSIRRVNNVGTILDAAKLVKNKKIVFLIWGDGDELDILKKRVIDEGIENVKFKGKVPKTYIPNIASKCDLGIFHVDDTKLVKYGFSLNKMFDYFAAGLPVITDAETEYNPAVQCNAGGTINKPDGALFAEIIDVYSFLSQTEISSYKANSLIAAEKYSFNALTENLIRIIDEI